MQTLTNISKFVGKYMALIIILVAAIALLFPAQVSAVAKGSYINPLLGLIMFGMGLTLKAEDFKVVITKPKAALVGIACQFVIMPFVAFCLVKVFNLPPELAIGVILVGTCPGGTSSNVITYLSKGDVALSVDMTACTTLLAPIVTPALTLLLAGQNISVDPTAMFLSIIQIVIVPIALGVLVNKFFSDFAQNLSGVLPLVSIFGISMILAAVVSANESQIMSVGLLICVVVILHNVLGYMLGFAVASAMGFTQAQRRAISVEVGMQNSGLATSLAATHFAQYPLVAVPGAVFSVWHNLSGAILANIFRATYKEEEPVKEEKLSAGVPVEA